jgi:3-phosphoshikimate 1-carboxyvinyltransferase
MTDFNIEPCKSISGVIDVPGDKSISHRLAMLCGLARGESVIRNYLMSEDCLNTLHAVEQLGAGVTVSQDDIRIVGVGGSYAEPADVLDMGNSGTGMRLMAGLLAGQSFDSCMTGDESLCSRPMNRIKGPLELMGADINLCEGGCAPMDIKGKSLLGIEYELPVASAQVKSCILLAGMNADGVTRVIEPRPTRDHTEKLMSAMGMDVQVDGARISIDGGDVELVGGEWDVPGDFSSAAFWIAAAACMDGAELTIKGVGLNPRRTAFLDVLKRMGADIRSQKSEVRSQRAENIGPWEEIGDITVKGKKLVGTEVGGDEIPNLIDELPLVAVVGALAEGETIIRDAAELRVKESDRIATVAAGLKAFGVSLEEKPDGLIVKGGAVISGGIEINSHGDHRIAMAMSILGLFADAPVKVCDVACVDTSYPGFMDDMEKVVS